MPSGELRSTHKGECRGQSLLPEREDTSPPERVPCLGQGILALSPLF
jgi:hypothetical protein